jgi:hypothetical protein
MTWSTWFGVATCFALGVSAAVGLMTASVFRIAVSVTEALEVARHAGHRSQGRT